MSTCDCNCKGKPLNGKWCDRNESQEDIKRAGDIVKDSEQCDIVPNIEKGIFRLWCRLKEIIVTICDVLQRMVCLQKKAQKACEAQHCLDSRVVQINEQIKKHNESTAKTAKDFMDKWQSNKAKAENNFKKATASYEEQLERYKRNKEKFDRIKSDPSTLVSDGIYVSGNFKESARGSFGYYSDISISTEKEGTEFLLGSIEMRGGEFNFQHGDLRKGATAEIRNVGITSKGRNVHLRVTFSDFNLSSHATSQSAYTDKEWLYINSDKGAVRISVGNFYRVAGSFEFFDDYNTPLSIMLVNVVNDIDFKQGFWVRFNNSATFIKKPNDSGISDRGGYLSADTGVETDRERSIPKGSLVFAGVGSRIDWEIIANHPGVTYIDGDNNTDASFEMLFFGNDFQGEIIDLSKPREPKAPVIPPQPEPAPKPLPPIGRCELYDCNFDCLGDN